MWLVWAAAPTPDSETIQRAGLIHTLRMRCFSLHYRAIGPSLLVTQTTGDDRFLSSSRFVFFLLLRTAMVEAYRRPWECKHHE